MVGHHNGSRQIEGRTPLDVEPDPTQRGHDRDAPTEETPPGTSSDPFAGHDHREEHEQSGHHEDSVVLRSHRGA